MPREYHQGTWEQVRALSPAVVTRGGRVVWLSGDIGAAESEEELAGQSIEHDRTHFPPDFDSQVHNTFRRIGATLGKVGGTLHDIVKMTVYIKDGRNQQRFVELRKGYFPENAPASTLITITGFAIPEMQIEIDAIAVIGDE